MDLDLIYNIPVKNIRHFNINTETVTISTKFNKIV